VLWQRLGANSGQETTREPGAGAREVGKGWGPQFEIVEGTHLLHLPFQLKHLSPQDIVLQPSPIELDVYLSTLGDTADAPTPGPGADRDAREGRTCCRGKRS